MVLDNNPFFFSTSQPVSCSGDDLSRRGVVVSVLSDPQIQKCPGVSPHTVERLVGLRQSTRMSYTGHPTRLSLEGSHAAPRGFS